MIKVKKTKTKNRKAKPKHINYVLGRKLNRERVSVSVGEAQIKGLTLGFRPWVKKQTRRIKENAIKLVTKQTRKTKSIILKSLRNYQKTFLPKINLIRGRASVKSNRDRVSVKAKEKRVEFPIFFSLLGWQPRVALILRRIREDPLWPFRKYWQEATVLILILTLVGSGFLFFQNVKNILAATYYWIQLSWSGGADTVNFPAHPANETGWTKYYSKDANITAGTELTLVAASTSITQTTDDDFNAGTKDDVYVSGGNVYLQKPLGKTCSAAIECVSGYCVDGVCCNTACTGTCQACNAAGNLGTCTNIPVDTDPGSECPDSGCYTGNCDGSGACGYQTSAQDLYSYCGTTGCYTDNCIGGSNACGYYNTLERNCTTACTTCDGATSGSCVSMTDNTQDTEGSYTCSATCKKCSSGSCGNQGVEDLFSQCSDTQCYTGNCDGSGACGYQTSAQDLYSYCGTTGCYTDNCIGGSNACGYYTSGERNCTTACTTCDGATSASCVNMANNTQDTQGVYTCSATCKKCSAGSCVNQGVEDLFSQCADVSCAVNLCNACGTTCTTLCAGTYKNSGLCNGSGACAANVACGCVSVGTDTAGTNTKLEGTNPPGTCWESGGGATCGLTLVMEGYLCAGHNTWWTYCKCGP